MKLRFYTEASEIAESETEGNQTEETTNLETETVEEITKSETEVVEETTEHEKETVEETTSVEAETAEETTSVEAETAEETGGKNGWDKVTTEKIYEADTYWNEDLPYGYNWGLEALKIPSAWDTLDFYDNINPAKVGVIDTGFDENHKDLSFAYIFGNNNHTDKNHGTHVAGIMAAKHNNNLGISGVLTNCKLYGYANGKPSIENINSLMEYKIALAYLIGNNVKVINISQSFEEVQTDAISRGSKKAELNAFEVKVILN